MCDALPCARFLALILVAAPAYPQVLGQGSQQGQGQGGRTVSGSIAFMGGAPTAVQVTVESSNRSINRTLFSDGAGSFSASGLPPGEYYITLEAPGYARQRTSIDVPPGNGVLVFQFMMRPLPPESAGVPGNPISTATLQVPAAAQQEFDKGLAEWKKKKQKEARAHFEKALQKHADYPQTLWALAQLDVAENQNQAPMERLRKAVTIDPAFYHGHLSLSRLLRQSGDYAGSLEEADKAVAARPDQWEAHYERGIAALALNRLPVAEECVPKVQELSLGKAPEARLLRSGVMLKKGDLEGARGELESFLREAPEHATKPPQMAAFAPREVVHQLLRVVIGSATSNSDGITGPSGCAVTSCAGLSRHRFLPGTWPRLASSIKLPRD